MFLRKFSLNSAVGAPRPSQRELDDDVMHNSFIVADSVESATNEAGDVILSKVNWWKSLGNIALAIFSQKMLQQQQQ